MASHQAQESEVLWSPKGNRIPAISTGSASHVGDESLARLLTHRGFEKCSLRFSVSSSSRANVRKSTCKLPFLLHLCE